MIHNSCNMAIRDLPDMYTLIPRASGIHIRQIPHGHVTTITYEHVYLTNFSKMRVDLGAQVNSF